MVQRYLVSWLCWSAECIHSNLRTPYPRVSQGPLCGREALVELCRQQNLLVILNMVVHLHPILLDLSRRLSGRDPDIESQLGQRTHCRRSIFCRDSLQNICLLELIRGIPWQLWKWDSPKQWAQDQTIVYVSRARSGQRWRDHAPLETSVQVTFDRWHTFC